MPPDDATRRLSDLLSAPLEDLIVALGSGIGRSQAELDRHSVETQRRIDEDPLLAQYGLRATWYQIPRTELELRIAVAMQRQEDASETPGTSPAPRPGAPPTEFVAGGIMRPLPRLHIQPVNATYQNRFGYDVSAASTMKLSIVPVPPPAPVSTAPARMTEAEVREAAAAATLPGGGPVLYEEPAAGFRTAVNFNAGLRAWFVVQTQDEDDKLRLRALVKIDDETGEVLKAERPADES